MSDTPTIATVTDREDTIAALATPPGTSGIAVVRVSGTDAIARAAGIFSRADSLLAAPSHTVHHGFVRTARGEAIDETLVSVFRSPHSYTGEDSAEISCHGGTAVSRAVLERLFETGVRHALPGEFTRRAFLNGKLDLAQAEAVADLISAQSDAAHRASMRQLEGALSKHIAAIREELVRCASMLELSLDFAEEDVRLLSADELRSALARARDTVHAALDTYASGRVLREGLTVVLAGRPNAGKSSMLNALLGTRRAIVTDMPGTTRDYIEEQAMLHGSLVRFVDTAGLRSAGDSAERAGVALSKEWIAAADVVCYLIDASEEDIDAEQASGIQASIERATGSRAEVILLANKADIVTPETRRACARVGLLPVSALTGDGLDTVTSRLSSLARTRSSSGGEEVLVTNARHAECLRRSSAALDAGLAALADGRTEEILAYDVRGAIRALDEIIGTVTSDDVLNAIFSRFCIGK